MPSAWPAVRAVAQRRQVLRQTAVLLRQMHEAGCYLTDFTDDELAAALCVRCRPEGWQVLLGSVGGARRQWRPPVRARHRAIVAISAVCSLASGGLLAQDAPRLTGPDPFTREQPAPPMQRAVTLVPLVRPAIGELFAPMVIEIAGSSTVMSGSGLG